MSELAVRQTSIPGLLEIDLVVHGDNRGWFKENYQRAKLEALGLPAFDPAHPDPVETFTLPASPFTAVARPAGS